MRDVRAAAEAVPANALDLKVTQLRRDNPELDAAMLKQEAQAANEALTAFGPETQRALKRQAALSEAGLRFTRKGMGFLVNEQTGEPNWKGRIIARAADEPPERQAELGRLWLGPGLPGPLHNLVPYLLRNVKDSGPVPAEHADRLRSAIERAAEAVENSNTIRAAGDPKVTVNVEGEKPPKIEGSHAAGVRYVDRDKVVKVHRGERIVSAKDTEQDRKRLAEKGWIDFLRAAVGAHAQAFQFMRPAHISGLKRATPFALAEAKRRINLSTTGVRLAAQFAGYAGIPEAKAKEADTGAVLEQDKPVEAPTVQAAPRPYIKPGRYVSGTNFEIWNMPHGPEHNVALWQRRPGPLSNYALHNMSRAPVAGSYAGGLAYSPQDQYVQAHRGETIQGAGIRPVVTTPIVTTPVTTTPVTTTPVSLMPTGTRPLWGEGYGMRNIWGGGGSGGQQARAASYVEMGGGGGGNANFEAWNGAAKLLSAAAEQMSRATKGLEGAADRLNRSAERGSAKPNTVRPVGAGQPHL